MTRRALREIPASHSDILDAKCFAHVATLRARGATVMEPDSGELASGLRGQGRFPEVADIVEAAAGGVGDLAGCIGVERVHSEITALRVFFPAFAERDRGAAAIGADVAAQRGDFERLVIDDDRDRAVLDAGWMRGKAGSLGNLRHPIRRQLRGDVDIIDLPHHQRIAHTAADETRATGARGFERGEQRLRLGRFEPSGVRDRRAHLPLPLRVG